MSRELTEFTRRAMEAGATREQVAEALSQAGWARSDIASALDSFSSVPFPIPVPRPKAHASARDAFSYLLLFFFLYASLWSLVSLIFEIINRFVPDPLQARNVTSFMDNSIRWNIAILIVAFPLFLFMFRLVGRSLALHPARRISGPRRWMTYLTLFATALVLVVDIASLVYNLLGGELTLRFFLKIFTIGLIVGGVFLFFLQDMRRDQEG
ncbi:MAG: hypothetical protein NVS2B5_24920 [Beijerinckiaceae bacterium]